MKNIKQVLNGDILTLTIDLSQDFGKSGSGKTTIIATSSGNVSVEGKEEIKMGINVYKK